MTELIMLRDILVCGIIFALCLMPLVIWLEKQFPTDAKSYSLSGEKE
jgi:hypothetical protein